jgi:hypothetical protein
MHSVVTCLTQETRHAPRNGFVNEELQLMNPSAEVGYTCPERGR